MDCSEEGDYDGHCRSVSRKTETGIRNIKYGRPSEEIEKLIDRLYILHESNLNSQSEKRQNKIHGLTSARNRRMDVNDVTAIPRLR